MGLPDWAKEKFSVKNSTSGDDVFATCLKCWSMVDIADVKMHDKWHQGETYIDPEV